MTLIEGLLGAPGQCYSLTHPLAIPGFTLSGIACSYCIIKFENIEMFSN